jgi:hypothetical protein
MFAKATAKFVEEVDRSLKPASSCNNSIKLLSIVMEQKGRWLFQKTKYSNTPFTLDEMLQGDTVELPGKQNSQYSHLQLKMFSLLLYLSMFCL